MKLAVVLLITFYSYTCFADFEFYRGVRMMGMGGAGIAVVNDETSPMVNPNGLGRLRDYFFTLVDPEVTNSVNGSNPLIGTGVFSVVDPQTLYDELADRTGKPFYFKGQVFPSVVVPNFGLGLLGKYELLVQHNNDGTFEYNTIRDYALVSGFNLRFWGGRIKLGFSGRLMDRKQFFGVRDPATDSMNLDDFAVQGVGLGVDGGLTFAAPWQWLPTLAAVVRDIGGTSFTMGDGFIGSTATTGSPDYIPYTVDVGIAVFPILANNTRATITADYRDVLNDNDAVEVADRLHIGGELNLFDAYFVRAGYGANHWTAGFEYATSLFQWQLATYAETVDFTGNNPKEDRRWILKFVFRQ